MNLDAIETPALLIDHDILMENLKRMQQYANSKGVLLRPHTKTHKIPRIALLQMEVGAVGIAVAKVSEAEVMAENGLSDIFIANEIIGLRKLERITHLMEKAEITFGVDSAVQLNQIEDVFSASGKTAMVMIEVEVGEVRCGIDSDEECHALLRHISRCPHICLKGFFGHDGNTYRAMSNEDCIRLSLLAQQRLVHFAQLARENGFEAPVVSYGSTPPFLLNVDLLDGITEIRPGTYALMDASQGFASGSLKNCAATVLSTVISKPPAGRVILDVGAKGITMQERTDGICCSHGKGIIKEYPNVSIAKVYDEHAIIHDPTFFEHVSIGEKVRIIPAHICPVCNLYDRAFLVNNGVILDELKISARGKLQ